MVTASVTAGTNASLPQAMVNNALWLLITVACRTLLVPNPGRALLRGVLHVFSAKTPVSLTDRS